MKAGMRCTFDFTTVERLQRTRVLTSPRPDLIPAPGHEVGFVVPDVDAPARFRAAAEMVAARAERDNWRRWQDDQDALRRRSLP